MKKLLAFVLAVTLMALQTGLPVYAEEMPGPGQGAQTGDIAVPEQEQGVQTGDIAVPEPEQGAQTGDITAPETEKVPAPEEPADAGEKAKEPGSSEGGEKPVPEEEGLQEEAVSAVSGQEIPEVEKPEPGKAAGPEAAEIEEPAGDGGSIEVVSWNGLQEAFNNASVNSESPTRITLSGNVVMPEEIKIDQKIFGTNLVVPAGKYVVLDLKGHTIDRKLGDRPYVFGEYLEIMEAMNVITVSGNLTLEDSSGENAGKITGGYGNPAGGVTVTSGASFTMKGGRITGNRACCASGDYVGGVYVAEGAQFLMEGGSIDDNKNADGSGGAGGVFVSGSFTMSGNSSITNNNADIVGTGGVKVYGQGASFTMNDGTIKGNHSGDGQGGGVFVFNGTFEMNDGDIEDNESKKASFGGGGGVYVYGGTFTMRGGRINGNTVSVTDTVDRCGGGGVLVSDGKFTMEGGYISGNKVDVKGKNSGGGGVYARGGTFIMKRGSISGNSVTGSAEQCGGGGVLINNGGKFTMEDGIISSNTANVTGSESGGGGVYSGGGTFTMKDGSITGNTADVTGSESGGGGVYSGHGIFTMEGGSITGNNVSGEASRGGGVYVCPHGNSGFEKFELSGTPIIRDNVKGGNLSGEVYTGETKSNVWLYSDENKKAVIYDVTGLEEGAEIWVGSESEEIVYDASESSVKYLHADNDSLVAVFVEDGYIYLREKTTWPWLQEKFNAASDSEASPTKICMNYDAVAGESDTFLYVPAGKYVKLDLNGFSIDRGLAGKAAYYPGNVITVKGNLTLTDSSDKSDTPEYDGTGAITGGNNRLSGGGVYVAENGTFTMEGGSISGNNVNFSEGSMNDFGGGGVYVNINGTFTMTGGSISGNNVNVSSGQVSRFGGGGVYVYRGRFTMEGGSISGNKVTANADDSGGGGVYVNGFDGTFTMTGGSITGNNASSSGGGVFLNLDSSFKISGTPVIKDNDINGYHANNVLPWRGSISVIGELTEGAEIWIFQGIAQGTESHTISMDDVKYFHSDDDSYAPTLEGDKITLRKKTDWAGLQLQFDAASGSKDSPTKIYMNQAAVAGGSNSALTVPDGKYVELDLNGFKIDRGLSGNGAKPDGNIITVSGNLTLKDSQGTGILTGGNSTGKAGGVQVLGDGSRFEMQGGRIALNLTSGIGGVWVSENGVFSMTGGEITQNAGIAGGGVGFEGGSFELGGDPKISGNVKGNVIQDGKIVGGKTNNVNVHSGKTISINGAMTNKTPVGVTTVPEPTGGKQIIFTDNWGAHMQGKSPTEFFSSDNEKYSVVMQDGEAALVGHVHKLTYRAEGNTVTAVCSGDENCGFPDHTATLTIEAPEHKVYADSKSPEAQISDDYQIQGTASVGYYKADPSGSRSGEALAAAPTGAGRYWAEITLGEGGGSATAYVVYEIEKAVPVYIIPTGLTAVYGQTLKDVKLPESSNGAWTWADDKASVGDAVEKTFKGVFTPEDTDNYKTVTVDVAVNVAKADYTRTSLSANQRYGTKGMIELKDYIPEGGETGEVTAGGDKEVLSGNAVAKDKVLSCVLKDSRDYVGKKVVLTIPVRSCKNYKDYSLTVTLTVADCSHTSTELRHVLKATCMEKGYSGDLCCKDCNALIKAGEETPIDPENHDFDMEKGEITTEPTYLSYGAHTYYCRRNKEHTLVLWNIEPLPAPDGKNYGDLAEDTRGLSENAAPKVETKTDEKGNEVTTVSINGAEVEQVVKDPESGKETVKSLVWIGGLKESYRYTGAAIKPEFHVYDGTNKLTEKTDYTVSFKKNKDVGTGEITVKFKGNYGDTKPRTLNFEIKPAILGEDIIAHETGVTVKKSAQKPVPVLTWASTGKTVAAKDFNIIYDPAEVKDAGTYTATITPKKEGGNFDGRTTALVKVAAKDKVLSNVKVRFDPASYPYNGKPVEPKYSLTMGTTTLTEGTDFECVSLTGNINPGTAVITFEAISGNEAGYVGSKTATFKITGKKSLTDAAILVTCDESAPFAKGGAKAAVTVKDRDTDATLKEGLDYTLSYAKNKALGTTAEVKVKGKGNYKDSVTKTFTVTKQSLKSISENIIVSDQFTTKSKLKAPKVTITDSDGKKLSSGKDYTVGDPDYSTPGNTEDSGVVYITVTGKGNYSETESVRVSFRYTKDTASNISKARTKAMANQPYTGNAVKLSKSDLTEKVYTGSRGSENYLKPGTDFEVIDSTYTNNVKKGTAKVTVRGLDKYAGTKTLSFKIVQKGADYQGALIGDGWVK